VRNAAREVARWLSNFCDARKLLFEFSRAPPPPALRSVMSVNHEVAYRRVAFRPGRPSLADAPRMPVAVYSHHTQLAPPFVPPPMGLFSEQVVDVLVFLEDEPGDRLLWKSASRATPSKVATEKLASTISSWSLTVQ